MPGSYWEEAVKIYSLQYSTTKSALRHKWGKLVKAGHVVPLVHKHYSPFEQGPSKRSITMSRNWSDAETQVLFDVMTGANGLMQSPTTPRNLFAQAANRCKLRGVKVC